MRKLLLLAVLFLSGCTVVGPQQRAVHVSLGSVSDELLRPGPHIWIPFFYGNHKFDISLFGSNFPQQSAGTKDMQEVTTSLVVNWSMKEENIIDVFKRIGDEDTVFDRIISPTVKEALKAVVSKYTAEECLTKRAEIKKEIDDYLKKTIESKGLYFDTVSITEFKFSPEFEKAVEAKQIAEQQAKQAEYTSLKAIQDAKAIKNLAVGQAEANSLMRSSLTREMLDKMAIEKWNGVLPVTMMGNSVPFINVNK